MIARQHALEQAYAEAEYRVHLPGETLLLRIGAPDPLIDAGLRERAGVLAHWAILTPFNPRSYRLAASANRLRLQELIAALDAGQQRWWHSSNSAAGAAEPLESGVLWCDPAAGAAAEMGRRFQQNAIVIGRLGEPAQLEWLY